MTRNEKQQLEDMLKKLTNDALTTDDIITYPDGTLGFSRDAGLKIENWHTAEVIVAMLNAYIEENKDTIKQLATDTTQSIESGLVGVKFSNSKRMIFDKKKLFEKNPSLRKEDYQKESISTKVTVNWHE